MRCWLLGLVAGRAAAENGLSAWLRYAPVPGSFAPSVIVATNASRDSPVYTAGRELQQGIRELFGKYANISHDLRAAAAAPSILVGTAADDALGSLLGPEDGFVLDIRGNRTVIVGQSERGALYGAFEYLSRLARGDLADARVVSSPDAPIRWVNQWDNPDGSIERGYGGRSIFFENGFIPADLSRVAQYARLLASVRLNAIVVNNVNADPALLNDANIDGLGRIADAMRPYGVRLGVAVNFAAPQQLGGLATYDPLDPAVVAWWAERTAALYRRIPDLAGYLVKASSEGQPGPLVYNRTLADGANLVARALRPHGGIAMFRAFVYNQHLDEADWKADRARAAVDYFAPLDGQFDDNVVVQIKYGPIDFQVREPASPLFAHLPRTNVAIELQVTQEYLGQQSHLVYLPPLWKTILDFDMRANGRASLVRDIVAGRRFNRTLGGYAAVVNVGRDSTWLGSHLSMSNLFAYGRLAWDPTADPYDIVQEWARLTFGLDERVIDTVTQLSLASWTAYEGYTGNLGIQTLTDITGNHYGPNPASQDGNGWGMWTRSENTSIGMDRTVANGTGFAGQYPPEVARVYENLSTTPDELLLWFHHVPYTHLLRSGKTVIQHFYDQHYFGRQTAQTFPAAWQLLKGKIDDERFDHVLFRLRYQAGHADVWRDAVSTFYHELSGIPDKNGRVGRHRRRIEAEAMRLTGYVPIELYPAVTASNGSAVVTVSNTTAGTAEVELDVAPGWYAIAVNYFDVAGGRARWDVFLNDMLVGSWIGDSEDVLGHAASSKPDGGSAVRITLPDVQVQRRDTLRIVGTPNGAEMAPLDYVSLLPRHAK
ncbi:alpha-glucuronidase [Thozetella sp. PMI_491]|nr:alpha-glucuronidase [Thozetella sp. PMI_491]